MADKLRGKWLNFAITFSAGSSYLLFGYDQVCSRDREDDLL